MHPPIGPDVQLEVPADAGEIPPARRTLGAWATQLGLPPDTVHDLVLATHEALANAVDHAYPNNAGRMSLTARCTGADVLVEVRDHGNWRPPRQANGRGRGLLLIRNLAHHVDIHPTADGTTVRMTWRTGSSAQ